MFETQIVAKLVREDAHEPVRAVVIGVWLQSDAEDLG
jgi:hypothetical protein